MYPHFRKPPYLYIILYLYIISQTISARELHSRPLRDVEMRRDGTAGAHHSLAGGQEEGDDDSVGAPGDVNVLESAHERC